MLFMIKIDQWIHVSKARREAAKLASELGFTEIEIGEMSIIVSELAENLLNHQAVQGKIMISTVSQKERTGIQIISEDEGPGIANVQRAVGDGFSESSTLGIGLGAVKRLSDEFDIYSKIKKSQNAIGESSDENIGTIVLSRKWLSNNDSEKMIKYNPLRFGIMSRPKKGEKCNGDNYLLKYFGTKIIISLIDGLGHGEEAEIASTRARQIIEENCEESLESLMKLIHQALHKTRGAVCAIVLIDEKEGMMKFSGIGNIRTLVWNAPEPIKPVNYNGILGHNLHKVQVFTYPWHKNNLLMMHSDGISSKFDPGKYPGLLSHHPMVIADIVLRDYGKLDDDATVVVGGHFEMTRSR